MPCVAFCKAKGAHVLVRRGGCSFLAKALSVSDSGGHSLIVVDEGAGRLRMEVEEGENVDIPVVMVSKLDGERVSSPIERNKYALKRMAFVRTWR